LRYLKESLENAYGIRDEAITNMNKMKKKISRLEANEKIYHERLKDINKKIEDSKDEVRKIIVKICASEFLDVSVYADKRTQDIINIIKGEVEK
jgi:seryl-tRNA synthetase